MSTALLQTTYFGPVQWYQKLHRYDCCYIEQHDSYQKQTYRNRCVIATANGPQALTVPVEHEACNKQEASKTEDLHISDHNQWRRVHWNALQSAYSESPFFDYYADDIHPFFEKKYTFLLDFNEAIRQTVCALIDIHPNVVYSSEFIAHSSLSESVASQSKFSDGVEIIAQSNHKVQSSKFKVQSLSDFRDVIHAKHPQHDDDFTPKPYWQVFQHRYGFQPNLSVLDLLFCMGPESIFYL